MENKIGSLQWTISFSGPNGYLEQVHFQNLVSRDNLSTLISLINVEVGINVEGVQKLPKH